ncbi:MAG: type II secretion system F family protein [Candidatus Omnitrophica bacterium]|nr:type II secretion system F family protein [Candidatus Omnitrophota bacterium]
MAVYNYRARDKAGSAVKGAMEAAAKDEVVERLRKMGYMATQVRESLPGIKIESLFEGLKRVSTEDMIIFNVQLSNMIGSGISILTSLDTISRQIENRRLRQIISGVARGVEAGESFSQALSRHPGVFRQLFISMVRAGESSGKLDVILARYAVFAEQQEDLRQKIKGALFYPAILLAAGIAVTLFVVTFIIPQFAQIFLKAGITLPLPTLILYKIGMGIKHFWYAIILFIIVSGLALRYYAGTKSGRLKCDRLKLNLPVLGPLHRKAAISGFSRTLSTLIASGVPILEALATVKGVIGNEVLENVIDNVRGAVEKGEGIAATLKVSNEFPPDTVQMISSGEESGALDKMLNKVADFYDMSLGHAVKKMTAVIEPLFLAVMGCMVGFIMLSMLLPIFDMMKILRR